MTIFKDTIIVESLLHKMSSGFKDDGQLSPLISQHYVDCKLYIRSRNSIPDFNRGQERRTDERQEQQSSSTQTEPTTGEQTLTTDKEKRNEAEQKRAEKKLKIGKEHYSIEVSIC